MITVVVDLRGVEPSDGLLSLFGVPFTVNGFSATLFDLGNFAGEIGSAGRPSLAKALGGGVFLIVSIRLLGLYSPP